MLVQLPSINESEPVESGGPDARSGFSYQDEVTISLLLDMVASPKIAALHIETHDDVVFVHDDVAVGVEYIQIKSDEVDSAWSVAKVCRREGEKAGTSVFERSLARDSHKEPGTFRIITARWTDSALKLLTLPRHGVGREPDSSGMCALRSELEKRCPGFCSAKHTDASHWLANCLWDVRYSEAMVEKDNLLRVITLSANSGTPLLPQQAEALLSRLRELVRTAARAKWKPDRDKKIVKRDFLLAWWKSKIEEMMIAESTSSGEKLRVKMAEAGLSQSLIQHARELRRQFAAEARAPRYMEPNIIENLKSRVSSEILSLQSQVEAIGNEELSGVQFHHMCIERIDNVISRLPSGQEYSAFLKGGMYDIADRCLLRFVRD